MQVKYGNPFQNKGEEKYKQSCHVTRRFKYFVSFDFILKFHIQLKSMLSDEPY